MLFSSRVCKNLVLRPIKKAVRLVRVIHSEDTQSISLVEYQLGADVPVKTIDLRDSSLSSRIEALSLIQFVTLDNGHEVVPQSPLDALLSSGMLTSTFPSTTFRSSGNDSILECIVSHDNTPVVGWLTKLAHSHQQAFVAHLVRMLNNGFSAPYWGMGKEKFNFSPRIEYFSHPEKWDERCASFARHVLRSQLWSLLSVAQLKHESFKNCFEFTVMLPILHALVVEGSHHSKSRHHHHLIGDVLSHLTSMSTARLDPVAAYAISQLHYFSAKALNSKVSSFVAQDRAAQSLYDLVEDPSVAPPFVFLMLPHLQSQIVFSTQSARYEFDQCIEQKPHPLFDPREDIDKLFCDLCADTKSFFDITPVLLEISVLSLNYSRAIASHPKFLYVMNRIRSTFVRIWHDSQLLHSSDLDEMEACQVDTSDLLVAIPDALKGYSTNFHFSNSDPLHESCLPYVVTFETISVKPLPDFQLWLFGLNQALRRILAAFSRYSSLIKECQAIRSCCDSCTWFAVRNVGHLNEVAIAGALEADRPHRILVSRFDNHTSSFTVGRLAFGQRSVSHLFSLLEPKTFSGDPVGFLFDIR